MITKVSKMGVNVGDQQRALDFFTKTLGFEVVTDVKMGEKARWIEVRPPGAETALALWTPPELTDRIGTFSHIVFESNDVHKTHDELVAKGVKFTQKPRLQGGGVMGVFVDPDGNSFVLRGPEN